MPALSAGPSPDAAQAQETLSPWEPEQLYFLFSGPFVIAAIAMLLIEFRSASATASARQAAS